MKKVHELLDDLNLLNEDINTEEEKMTSDEEKRILELTLNKAGLKNKRSFNKRFILPLAAAITLLLSFAVVFAHGELSNIFYKMFGENIKYVNKMGTVINESYSSNGIIFNVAHMLGDENSFYIIFELIKENGDSFSKSDYIQIENLRLDFKGSGGYTWYKIGDDNENDDIATFILYGNTKNKVQGDKLTMELSDITEYSIYEPENTFNAYDFLLKNEEFINQKLVKNLQKSAAYNNDSNLSDAEKEKADLINKMTPDEILPMKNDTIHLEENNNKIYIDNIGFANNKLCFRIAATDFEEYNMADIYFVNKNKEINNKYNDFVFSEEKNGVYYTYYVFDIKNMEELKDYDLKYFINKKLASTKGDWKVTFKADYKNTTEKINVDKKVTIQGKGYTIKNIKLSPISLNVELTNNLIDKMKNPISNFDGSISVIMKNGSIVELTSNGASTNAFTSSVNLMFMQPINTDEIDKIKVGDTEIQIK